MLDRTNEMFKWKNLPETVDKRLLETWLQTRGIIAFTNLPEHYIVYFGEYGGNRNEYYEKSVMHTKYHDDWCIHPLPR